MVQGLALMRFPWETLTPDTRRTLSIAVYNQASRWEQAGPLSAMEVGHPPPSCHVVVIYTPHLPFTSTQLPLLTSSKNISLLKVLLAELE